MGVAACKRQLRRTAGHCDECGQSCYRPIGQREYFCVACRAAVTGGRPGRQARRNLRLLGGSDVQPDVVEFFERRLRAGFADEGDSAA